MIEEQQVGELAVMSRLRSQKYYDSKGRQQVGKLMPMGLNVVKLASVYHAIAKNGNVYISVIFTKPKSNVVQLKTKIDWTPQQEFIFDYDKAREVCNVFSHELNPCPYDMDLNTYMMHVARRIKTFIGREVEILIAYEKEAKIDEYGEAVKRIAYRDDSDLVEYYTASVVRYFKVGEGREDWHLLYNMFYGLHK